MRPTGIDGRGPLDGVTAELGGSAVADNPLNEAGAFALTSDELPADDYPRSPESRPARTAGRPPSTRSARWKGHATRAGARRRCLTSGSVARSTSPRSPRRDRHAADEAVVQHAADVPPRDRGGGTVRHRRVDHAARSQRANLAGAAFHLRRRPTAVAPPVPAPLPVARIALPRPALPARGTRSPASRAAGPMSPSTCRPTPVSRST